MITGACPGFEDNIRFFDIGELDHQGDEGRLRDVLIVVDRERDVEIGIGPQLGRDECISRNISDGLQQSFAQFFNIGLCVRPSDRMRDIFNEFGAQSRIGIVVLRLGNGSS